MPSFIMRSHHPAASVAANGGAGPRHRLAGTSPCVKLLPALAHPYSMSTDPIEPPTPLPSSLADHDALPTGTRFGEFEILSVLGVGGFGIVYLAHDHSLDRQVALKEYMPGALASRGEGAMITVRSKSHQETYAIGLRSFVNEARLLARFDHPSLVKVYRFWEDNATAYMVMPFLRGVTLRDTRRAMSQAPDEAWIRSVVGPILGALDQMHREGVFHRDIAPDNVLLLKDGPPVLLDFGAARRVISDRTQSLTAILKPSYAPIEQYAEMAQMRQGPWTDLYALGAVIHYLLMGVPPAPATARAIQDDLEPIEERRVAAVSPRFMEIVAWMLALRPNQRPQSVAALRAVFDGHDPVPLSPSRTVPQPIASAPSPIGDATTLAVTPHTPTEVLTTPHVAPSTGFRSPTELDTIAQAAPPAAEPPMPKTYAPSTPMPTARPLQADAASGPIHPVRPANPARNTRPAGLPPMPAAGAAVIRQSHTSLWIFSGVAAVFFALLIGWAVMSGPGSGTGLSAADSAASAATAAASAKADVLAKTESPPPTTTALAPPTTDAAAAQPAGDASTADAPTLPPGRSPIIPIGEPTTPDVTATPPAGVTPAPARITRLAAHAAEYALPPGVAVSTRTATPPPTQSATTPPPAFERPPIISRPLTHPLSESALNAGSSVGAPVSRARQLGTAAPPGPRPPAPTQAQLLDQALTGRPVPISPTHPPTTVASPTPVAARGPASAREACGRRVFIALAVCMDERCEEPRFRNSQECVKILEVKRTRESR